MGIFIKNGEQLGLLMGEVLKAVSKSVVDNAGQLHMGAKRDVAFKEERLDDICAINITFNNEELLYEGFEEEGNGHQEEHGVTITKTEYTGVHEIYLKVKSYNPIFR